MFLAAGIEGMRVIANGADSFQDIAELYASVVPAHPGTVGRGVDGEFDDTGQRPHVAFIQPHAGRAHDALQYQRGFADFAALFLYKGLLRASSSSCSGTRSFACGDFVVR